MCMHAVHGYKLSVLLGDRFWQACLPNLFFGKGGPLLATFLPKSVRGEQFWCDNTIATSFQVKRVQIAALWVEMDLKE